MDVCARYTWMKRETMQIFKVYPLVCRAALYYLQSRGLGIKKLRRKIMVRTFDSEVHGTRLGIPMLHHGIF